MLENFSNPALFLFLLCLFFQNAYSQQNLNDSEAALISEFDHDEYATVTIVRLEQLGAALQNAPSSKGFVIDYRSRYELPGKSARFLNASKNYLVRLGVPPERIVLIDGGEVACPKAQLWYVPQGTIPKVNKESNYPKFFEDMDMPRKFDEFYFSTDIELDFSLIGIENGYGFSTANSFGAFADILKKEKDTLAYIIVYAQYNIERWIETDEKGNQIKQRRMEIDSLKIATDIKTKIRNHLINKYKLPPSKIKIINGGYRRIRQVELWILPRNQHPPVATPNAFPPENKKK